MMKHLVSVIKVAFFTALLVPQFVWGQVNYIETDEAQDLVLNSCSDNQITIFLFRYPDIGSKKTELDRHILEFEGLKKFILFHEINMVPIPGCTRPKQFELCGTTTLNPYMKYNPYLIIFSSKSTLWKKFESSEIFYRNASLFRKLTDKESARVPFLVSNDFITLSLVVEFLKSAEQGTHAFNESSKGVKSSTVDSLWIINFIQKEFDKRKVEQPTFSQAVEVKFGGYSGTVSSSSSSIGGDLQKRIEYATLEMDPGLVMNVGYSLPLGRSYSTADHCYEVVFQQLKFRAKSPVSTTEFSSSVIGVNGLYRLTFPMSNLSKMRIGGGPSLIYRLPFQQTTYTSFNLNTDAVIENLSNFDIGLVGQAQLEFSLSRTIAFLLDYRFNLGMISLDGSVGPSYKVNTSALSAGVRLPVR